MWYRKGSKLWLYLLYLFHIACYLILILLKSLTTMLPICQYSIVDLLEGGSLLRGLVLILSCVAFKNRKIGGLLQGRKNQFLSQKGEAKKS